MFTSMNVIDLMYICCRGDSGIVNVYEHKSVLASKTPKPAKILMNLTTPITGLSFNHDAFVKQFHDPANVQSLLQANACHVEQHQVGRRSFGAHALADRLQLFPEHWYLTAQLLIVLIDALIFHEFISKQAGPSQRGRILTQQWLLVLGLFTIDLKIVYYKLYYVLLLIMPSAISCV
jgi:hypothetical protein